MACRDFDDAFTTDLHHFGSGIDALVMARVRMNLAKTDPEAWVDAFDDESKAKRELEDIESQTKIWIAAIELSLQRAERRSSVESVEHRWAAAGQADLRMLLDKGPKRVVAAYRIALEGAPSEMFEVVQKRWQMYRRLGLFRDILPTLESLVSELLRVDRTCEPGAGTQRRGMERREAVLLGYLKGQADENATSQTDSEDPSPALRQPTFQDFPPDKVVLFVSDGVEATGRMPSRLPLSLSGLARDALRQWLGELVQKGQPGARLRGIAGGASGGDILFHEVCAEMDIPTTLCLAMPDAPHIAQQVQVDDEPDWVGRFRAIRQRSNAAGQVLYLGDSERLPAWLQQVEGSDFWQRYDRWLARSALMHGAEKLVLLVLAQCDADPMQAEVRQVINEVRDAGAEVVQIDTRSLHAQIQSHSKRSQPEESA